MTVETILKLIDAGFTRSEIMAMGNEQDTESQPEPEQPTENQTEPEQTTGTPTVDQRFESIDRTLANIVHTMERMAIRESRQPEQSTRTPAQVLEDVQNLYK